jgi:hypothetical protein
MVSDKKLMEGVYVIFFIIFILVLIAVLYVLFYVPEPDAINKFNAAAANSINNTMTIYQCEQHHSAAVCNWDYTFNREEFYKLVNE